MQAKIERVLESQYKVVKGVPSVAAEPEVAYGVIQLTGSPVCEITTREV
jgi:hypothetical protein